jgi:ribosomal protein S19
MGTFIIYKKNKYIQLKDLNKKFLIYNGKNLQKLIISKDMIGYKFGEFIMTRKVVIFKKKNNG